jgi:hypothetical protein
MPCYIYVLRCQNWILCGDSHASAVVSSASNLYHNVVQIPYTWKLCLYVVREGVYTALSHL